MAKDKEMYDELDLASGKKVVMRPARISDELEAAQAIPDHVKNPMTYALMAQYEMLRNRLVSINGNVVKLEDKAKLDNILERADVSEIFAYMEGEAGKPKPPRVNHVSSSGSK